MNRLCVTQTWEADGTKWSVLIRDVLEEEKLVVFLGSEKEQRQQEKPKNQGSECLCAVVPPQALAVALAPLKVLTGPHPPKGEKVSIPEGRLCLIRGSNTRSPASCVVSKNATEPNLSPVLPSGHNSRKCSGPMSFTASPNCLASGVSCPCLTM